MSVVMRHYHYQGKRNPIEDSIKMGHLWPFYDLKDYVFQGVKDVPRGLPTAAILKLTGATDPFSLLEIDGEGIHFGLMRNVSGASPDWVYAEEDKDGNNSTLHVHPTARLMRDPGAFRSLYARQHNQERIHLPLNQDDGAAYQTVWDEWGMLRVPHDQYWSTALMAEQVAAFLTYSPTSPLPRPFMLGDIITIQGGDHYGLLPNGWQRVRAI